ncbi:MAG: flagellar hook assembly protein FlgD [Gammaproteobacteria bacterium]|nr:flagellar hook assembly protein FlgD [Gammaproteobacteria bacterium]
MNAIETGIPEEILQANSLVEQSTTPKSQEELGQDEFLKLMLAQMEHQDPFQPLENGEFVAQMAQFSTVAGIESMKESLDTMSGSLAGNQLMQASSLIGRTAMVPSSISTLMEGSPLKGLFALPETTPQVTIDIYNSSGELVHQNKLGITEAGIHPFEWDGLLDDGTQAPEGDYEISVMYGENDNISQAGTVIENRISTISLLPGSTELTLETEEGNIVSLLDIQQLK